ncbi:metal-dependent hydrolase [Candidatus Pelagibacter sp. HIMB1509]|uniref:metal-dependent hydrolase n=1 Tax=Candidatus Pelagibacter sp. HIMB1509 TaxID=3413339 RepID=UPI003F85F15A
MEKKFLLFFYISLYGGLNFPDIDLILIFLGHRSIITHGILVPLLIYFLLTKEIKIFSIKNRFEKIFTSKHFKDNLLDYTYTGFLLGIAIHLCADLFPKNYNFTGTATIFLPFWIYTGKTFSILWIFGNMFFAVYIAFKKLNQKKINIIQKNIIFLSIIIIGIIYMIIDKNFFAKIIMMLTLFPLIWFYIKKFNNNN